MTEGFDLRYDVHYQPRVTQNRPLMLQREHRCSMALLKVSKVLIVVGVMNV
mgnify:FL=1|tara:strand:- start:15223 stop:15375 length:153 start_codon:yes stop_codon:yes gene_type:complete